MHGQTQLPCFPSTSVGRQWPLCHPSKPPWSPLAALPSPLYHGLGGGRPPEALLNLGDPGTPSLATPVSVPEFLGWLWEGDLSGGQGVGSWGDWSLSSASSPRIVGSPCPGCDNTLQTTQVYREQKCGTVPCVPRTVGLPGPGLLLPSHPWPTTQGLASPRGVEDRMAGGSGSQSPLNSRGTLSGFPSWEDLSTRPPEFGCVGGDCFSGICLVPAGPQRRPETGPTLPFPQGAGCFGCLRDFTVPQQGPGWSYLRSPSRAWGTGG